MNYATFHQDKITRAAGEVCPHFGDCGGCRSQDVPYDEQLRNKQRELEALLSDYWLDSIPIEPSPTIWHYRNKVDFNFAGKHYDEPPPKDFVRETVLGFNRRGRWYWSLDISECHIGPEWCDKLLASVRSWYRAQRLRAYDSRTDQGFLRVLLVREGKRTGESMVALITSEGDFDKQSFVESVLAAHPATSIYRGVFHGKAQGVFADELELLYGEPAIEEQLRVPAGNGTRNLRFRISPMSFFQTNTLATEQLYGTIRTWVQESRPTVLYDLYGGAGGIAFSCADACPIVRSVENVRDATVDGRLNAESNGIENVFFTTAKVKNYLLRLVETGGMEPGSVAVVDPPRAGMHPKALKRLINLRPSALIYVSCNPKLFAQELPSLFENYRVTRVRAFDLFPHTPHVELVSVLESR